MADQSAPYIPESAGARLATDAFMIELQFLNEDNSPRDVSAWVIGIQITNPQQESHNVIIANDSPMLSRPQNHIIRLKAATPTVAGLSLSVANITAAYELRWYRQTADGQVTFRYTDITVYKRLPKTANEPGPSMAEVFVSKLTSEGGETITTEIAAALQSRIYDVEQGLATARPIPVASLSAAQAVATGPLAKEFVDITNHKKYLYIPGFSTLLESVTMPAS
ncbi:hypothetical protein [Larkinella soli]|uniref:hypothetical protein n=1 Tax=Larkinella soli TaxID=1770527 RepID=UPI000FFB6C45|nr:hypothetical protein [Larkinella soli]